MNEREPTAIHPGPSVFLSAVIEQRRVFIPRVDETVIELGNYVIHIGDRKKQVCPRDVR